MHMYQVFYLNVDGTEKRNLRLLGTYFAGHVYDFFAQISIKNEILRTSNYLKKPASYYILHFSIEEPI